MTISEIAVPLKVSAAMAAEIAGVCVGQTLTMASHRALHHMKPRGSLAATVHTSWQRRP